MLELNWNDIAIRLKELRTKNNITIERLSEIVGVSSSFIGLIERAESGVSIENIYKLAQVFNVSVDYLLTGNDNANVSNAYARFDELNATLYDYTDSEIAFLIELSKFIKNRVDVK